MDLHDLKKMFDQAYENAAVTRQRAADDLVFYWVTQWDDSVIQTDLAFRGEFNIIRSAGRRIMADLRSNQVQPEFEPIDNATEEDSEFLDGLYRSDDRKNSSQEAYFNAMQEQVVCGAGAWELYTDYENIRGNDKKQVIRRMPIHEANNVVFWDPNSKLLDKSDAAFVFILTRYSKEGYEEFVEEITGEEDYKCNPTDFKFPQYSYTFPWVAGNFDWVYVGTCYHRELEEDVILSMMDPITQEISDYWESEVKEGMDDLIDAGNIIVNKKKVKRWVVTKYIASGEKILTEDVICGEHIPVVQVYGERAIVEGQETWEGITKLAKDPQRLRNFLLSYIADIASRSPRPKPMFYPEQVQGFENMYEENNNYPYYLINRKSASGEDLPPGIAGQMPEQKVPDSVLQLSDLSKSAVMDVLGEQMPKDFASIDLSGNAIAQLNARIDMQSVVFQENLKHAKRRDAEIYASMASCTYDAPRQTTIVMPDGTSQRVDVMSSIIDEDTGNLVILNDLRNKQFEVYCTIGPSYASQKDKLRAELSAQIAIMPPDDPMRMLFMLKYAELMDGTGTKDIRDYAKKQLILNGYKEPETDEEIAMVEEANAQPKEPDAAMVLAQAEQGKAQAAQMREQNNAFKIQSDIEKQRSDTSVDIFNAQTSRFKAETDAQVKGEDIQIKKASLIGKQYNEMSRSLRTSVSGMR